MIAAILVDVKGSIHHEYRNILRHEVTYCSSGQCMTVVTGTDVDLAVLDCGCNPARGIDLLRYIKEARPELPVIFVTESGSEEIAVGAYKSGARDYFRKPIEEEEFRNSIETVLGFRRLCRERACSETPAAFSEGGGCSHPSEVIPAGIMRAVCFVESNLSAPLNLDRVASEACMSKYHFCRLFKKYLGVSPVQFVNKRRLRKAETLLRRGDMHIATVAVQSGFNDLSHFNKQFKKSFGVSPSVFRFSLKDSTH